MSEKKNDIKELSSVVFDFLKSNDLRSLPLGRHYLKNGVYANIEEYNTSNRSERKYEAHKKYIDIQMIISGSEKVIVEEVKNLSVSDLYDAEKDVAFYYDNNAGKKYELKEKSYVVFYPNQAHMPCVDTEEGVHNRVRKIVFKVPVINTKNIKAVVMDVDGTLTDGTIYMGEDMELFKSFNIKDGYGLANILPSLGISPVIMTSRKSQYLKNRCKELKIRKLYQGVKNKQEKLQSICNSLGVDLSQVVYIGDDDNDLACMKLVNSNNGVSACPRNSSKKVLNEASFISSYDGGQGAVREIIDWIANGKETV